MVIVERIDCGCDYPCDCCKSLVRYKDIKVAIAQGQSAQDVKEFAEKLILRIRYEAGRRARILW